MQQISEYHPRPASRDRRAQRRRRIITVGLVAFAMADAYLIYQAMTH